MTGRRTSASPSRWASRRGRTLLREPIGVVAAITPWNVPNQINLAKIGPALAAGCTVVLKPAPDTPWVACELGRLVAEHTDIPAGVFNVVTPSSNDVAAQLTSDPRVDMVSFTGSTATGRAIMAAAAPTLKKVFLELGGKSAAIVLDDADVSASAAATAFAACIHAGQGCALSTRLVVPRARYDEAVQAAAETMASIGVCGPRRARRDLRAGDLAGPARPGRGLSHARRAGGWPDRHRRQGHRPARILGRAHRRGRPRQLLAAGAGGDLRSRPRRHPARR